MRSWRICLGGGGWGGVCFEVDTKLNGEHQVVK